MLPSNLTSQMGPAAHAILRPILGIGAASYGQATPQR
jgi:hypothetical protein